MCPLAEEKTEGPTAVLCFLGLELDSIHMVIRIPKDKIEELVEKNQVYSDKTFCRLLISATCGLTKLYHHLRITRPIHLDLLMWLTFFHFRNSQCFFFFQDFCLVLF